MKSPNVQGQDSPAEPLAGNAPNFAESAILYRLTDGLFRARSLGEVFDSALDAITSGLGDRASILLFDEAGIMRFVAWRGLSDDYRRKLEGHSPWAPTDTHPDPILVKDIDDTDEPEWVKVALKSEGICGVAFIPLVSRGRTIGKFMSYFSGAHTFSESEVNLAVTIARQLGFGIERAQADEERQRAVEELRESEERFRLMSEQAPVMIWTSDTEGRCLHLNRLLREFWGVEDVATFDWQQTMHPDDAPEIGRRMWQAISNREAVTVDGRYLNADGTYRILRTEARPRSSPTGTFLGMIGVNVDVTERQRAEAALLEREERLRVALAAGRMGTWRYDLATGAQSWDERQYELFGLDPSVVPSRDLFLSIVHPEDYANVGFDRDTLSRDTFRDSEFRITRPDGTVRWITAHSIARHDNAGNAVELIGVSFDITDRKEAERRLRLLLDELNHRVKNTLAVVQAIAHQSFRDGQGGSAGVCAFEGRLIALATAHNLLTQSNWESAALDQLALNTLRSQGIEGNRYSVFGPPIILPAKQALAVAMALHELCTNAMKYGALSNEAGNVELSWEKKEDSKPSLFINWRERGGPKVKRPAHQGFGTRLIEQSLSHDLDAEVALQFEPEGVVCTIETVLSQA